MKRRPGKQTGVARRAEQPNENANPFLPADGRRVWLLAALTAVYVARPLLPSETPTITAGDGLPFAMLTLVLAVVWLLSQFARPGGGLRWGVAEAAWMALIAWLAVSAFAATRGGYARAAINGFWEWTALGLGFLLLRQLLRTAAEGRALLVVMAAVALVLSLDGLYEFKVEKPLVRARYRRDPEAVLAEAHVNAAPGSQARALFEQRLESSEPMATFALANSLAGLIAPWLLVALAIGWLGDDAPTSHEVGYEPVRYAAWRRRLTAALLVLPMAACLLLTKSRAGYLATLAGAALLVLVSRGRGGRFWLFIAAAAGAVSLLVGAGLAWGALDREIISEAFKSLSYRWHYWQGALGIVAEHPWLGCGPGNFQDEYTRFKLPEASEVVADPHNFAFEIWSTAGTPALLALLAVFAGIALRAFRMARERPAAERMTAVAGDAADSSWLAITAAGVAGFVLAYLVGLFSTVVLPWPVLAAGCVLIPAVSVCLAGWIRRGSLPAYVPFCAALALVINLLVAGGISFSGVAGSLWLLAAVGMRDADRRPVFAPRGALVATCLVSAVLFIACFWTAYRPVLACRGAMAQALDDPRNARAHLLAAAAADPLAAEPWQMLAEGDFAAWLRDTDRTADNWQDAQREFLRRRPHSSAAWHEAADRYLAAAEQTAGAAREAFLLAAIDHFQRAAELYPNSALVHAHLSMALAAAKRPEAGEQAALALRLHTQTPHLDLRLPAEILHAVQVLANHDSPRSVDHGE